MKREKDGTYLVDGLPLISVTTVLSYIDKPGLRYWYGKYGTEECEKIKHQSASIGTAIHALVQKDLQGGRVLKKELKGKQIATGYESYKLFKSEHKPDETRTTIYDFKTSSYYDKSFELQLSAYSHAEALTPLTHGFNSEIFLVNKQEQYAGTADAIYVPDTKVVVTPPKLLIVQLAKDSVKYKITETEDRISCYQAFLALKNFAKLWRKI